MQKESYEKFSICSVQFSSVTQSCTTLCDTRNHSMPGLPVHPNPQSLPKSCPLSRWCHTTISFFIVSLSSHPQSFAAWGSFQMSQLFTSGEVSASTSVLPMNPQDWYPLGWSGCIFLQSMGLSRVFSNTTVQKHQFFGTQLSLQSNSHIHT